VEPVALSKFSNILAMAMSSSTHLGVSGLVYSRLSISHTYRRLSINLNFTLGEGAM
jgi:hypothetical protein